MRRNKFSKKEGESMNRIIVAVFLSMLSVSVVAMGDEPKPSGESTHVDQTVTIQNRWIYEGIHPDFQAWRALYEQVPKSAVLKLFSSVVNMLEVPAQGNRIK